MKVLVLDAGVAGVSSARYLAEAGHEITVIDRAEGMTMETSFVNAGQLSYGYTTPWATPDIPTKALRWSFKSHPPLLFRPDGSLYQVEWSWQMLQNCTAARYQINKERIVRISEYSREMFRRFEAQTGMNFEGRKKGTLQILRQTKEAEAVEQDIVVLERCGVPYRRLKLEECAEFEPALVRVTAKIAGGLHLPADATGGCHLSTENLYKSCLEKGVQFHFNWTTRRVEHNGQRISAIETETERFEADAFVCVLDCFSRTVLAQLDLNLPIYPVKGYSPTPPVTNSDGVPVSTVLDESYKVAITWFDNRICVGGIAELSGYEVKLPEKRHEALALVVNDLFPGGGDLNQALFWSGLRPTTPDSTPLIGCTRSDSLFLNTGRGTLDWTMSLGSTKLTVDIVSGKDTEIHSDDLSLSHYQA